MSGYSREARFAVYLLDPGPDLPGVRVLLQEILGVTPEGASDYLARFPSLISYHETETAARRLTERFRDFDAVAVVRKAGKAPRAAPVEEVELLPIQRVIQWALVVLGVVQLGVAAWWASLGHWVPAFFGLCLGVYVLIYFGGRLRR